MIMALLDALLSLALLSCMAWGAMALAYRLPASPMVRRLVIGLWLLASGLLLFLAWQGARLGPLGGMAVLMLGLLAWWRSLTPEKDLDWAEDVAHLATGELDGDALTLHHVRHFDWHSRDEATPAWEERRYDLRGLGSVDLFVSRWGRPGIAHVMVSFGFSEPPSAGVPAGDEGIDFVVFSVEVRRKEGERFSEIGGFFKQYELAIIAADERDAVRLRSNVRGEEVTLYHMDVSPETRRELLLSLVASANRLERQPRFYHTITTNCTTLVYSLLTPIVPGLPLDHRLLLTGLLPGYIHEHGGFVDGYSLEQLGRRGDITEPAREANDDPAFSRRIRVGVPGWESLAGSART
jgi:hypothetical protein